MATNKSINNILTTASAQVIASYATISAPIQKVLGGAVPAKVFKVLQFTSMADSFVKGIRSEAYQNFNTA